MALHPHWINEVVKKTAEAEAELCRIVTILTAAMVMSLNNGHLLKYNPIAFIIMSIFEAVKHTFPPLRVNQSQTVWKERVYLNQWWSQAQY